MKITIYDVAKASGVSPSTVSKVIHGTGRYRAETRARVMATMERLDFRPSVVASALKAKRTYTVALLISDITNPFCSSLAKSVEDAALSRGYNVLVASTGNDPGRHHIMINMLMQKQVDGYILSSFNQDERDYDTIVSSGRPVVLADRLISHEGAIAIASDNVMGGYLATKYLLEKGHINIALVMEDRGISSSVQRMQGYVEAHRERGLTPCPKWVVSGHFGLDGGRKMLRNLYALDERPTALFAVNDLLAIGALQEAASLGWRIPDELSVIGYDDIPVSAMVHPPLTTIHQPIEKMGVKAFDALLGLIDRGTSLGSLPLLKPYLVERYSTAVMNLPVR